jgi:hypothetical protein
MEFSFGVINYCYVRDAFLGRVHFVPFFSMLSLLILRK